MRLISQKPTAVHCDLNSEVAPTPPPPPSTTTWLTSCYYHGYYCCAIVRASNLAPPRYSLPHSSASAGRSELSLPYLINWTVAISPIASFRKGSSTPKESAARGSLGLMGELLRIIVLLSQKKKPSLRGSDRTGSFLVWFCNRIQGCHELLTAAAWSNVLFFAQFGLDLRIYLI